MPSISPTNNTNTVIGDQEQSIYEVSEETPPPNIKQALEAITLLKKAPQPSPEAKSCPMYDEKPYVFSEVSD